MKISAKEMLKQRGCLTLTSFLNENIFSFGFLKSNENMLRKELLEEAEKIAKVMKEKYNCSIWESLFQVFDKWSEIKKIASEAFFIELCEFMRALEIDPEIIDNDEQLKATFKKLFDERYSAIDVRSFIDNSPSEYIEGVFEEIYRLEDITYAVSLSWDNVNKSVIFVINCDKFENDFIKKYLYSVFKTGAVEKDFVQKPADITSLRFDLSAKSGSCYVFLNGKSFDFKTLWIPYIEQLREEFAKLFLYLTHHTLFEFRMKNLDANEKLNIFEEIELKRLSRISQGFKFPE